MQYAMRLHFPCFPTWCKAKSHALWDVQLYWDVQILILISAAMMWHFVTTTSISICLPREREPKNYTSLPKMLSLMPSLGCQWRSYSRFVKFFRTHSVLNLQPRYLNIWILWTSCNLLGLPRPCELFLWAARLCLYGSASDMPTIKCLMVPRECQSLIMFLSLWSAYALWVSFSLPTFSK